jgi:hypothetical protein
MPFATVTRRKAGSRLRRDDGKKMKAEPERRPPRIIHANGFTRYQTPPDVACFSSRDQTLGCS